MLKILLALDDYQEQVYLHRLLTKMGFNVEVTQTDQAIGGLIMGFQPQVVFVAEKGRKINAIKLVKDIKAKKASTQFVLLKALSSNSNTDIEKLVHSVITSPVHPEELFSAVAEVSHLQKDDLISKFEKLSTSIKSAKQKQSDSQYVHGQSGDDTQYIKDNSKDNNEIIKPQTSVSDEQREQKYKNYLNEVESIKRDETTFERNKIKEFNKELRSQSEFHESPELKIDKFQYTKNLLKKKG